ncbi:MAG: tryptophan synthase subunit alpha [Planctomycetota bacterium]|jgi:tryptophan synthase alpha chain
MSNRIDDTFASLKAAGRAAFMPYLTAGDPDLETTRRLILGMAEAGADLIEVGVPFSDPVADGPTIQKANERALAAGTTLNGILEMIAKVRTECQVPILLMGSFNPIFVRGCERFCEDAAAAGVDGLIVPDLLPDRAEELSDPATKVGIHNIFLVAPTSTEERLELVAKRSSGFVYAVSLTGVTAERNALPPELGSFVERARTKIDLPIAVGFGISTPEMASEVGQLADGVIIGSGIVKRVAEACEAGQDPVPPVTQFVATIHGALVG